MKRELVWDLPIRLFHWAFAVAVGAALAIAFFADDDSKVFRLHMIFGIAGVFLLLPRLIMGIIGSKHARFANFPLHPRSILAYAMTLLTGKGTSHAGNNPGSAIAALLMFLLVAVLFISGAGLGGGDVEEIHELAAWALAAVVALHLAGIAWHTIRHKEAIALAMITGKKRAEPSESIPSSNPLWGLGMAIACGAWIFALFANNKNNLGAITLPALGVSVSVGEDEHGDSGGGHHDRDHDDHDEDDD